MKVIFSLSVARSLETLKKDKKLKSIPILAISRRTSSEQKIEEMIGQK